MSGASTKSEPLRRLRLCCVAAMRVIGSRTRTGATLRAAGLRVGLSPQAPLSDPHSLSQHHQTPTNLRPEWRETATLTTNYAANRLVLDPNEGFGRNAKAAPPLKSREEREAEDGGTYSDDDGEGGGVRG